MLHTLHLASDSFARCEDRQCKAVIAFSFTSVELGRGKKVRENAEMRVERQTVTSQP
jgi:hypothetical protein